MVAKHLCTYVQKNCFHTPDKNLNILCWTVWSHAVYSEQSPEAEQCQRLCDSALDLVGKLIQFMHVCIEGIKVLIAWMYDHSSPLWRVTSEDTYSLCFCPSSVQERSVLWQRNTFQRAEHLQGWVDLRGFIAADRRPHRQRENQSD